MPSSIIVHHPNIDGLDITFTESNHLYQDNQNRKYMSVTTLIKEAFEKFDQEKAAQMKAARTGEDPKALIAEWTKNGRIASENGTRCHEFAEHLLRDNIEIYNAETPEEKIKFNAIKKFIVNLKNLLKIESVECEKLVFSPNLLLAGSIDVLIKLTNGQYIIGDWKFLKKDLETEGFQGKTSPLFFMNNIQDCNKQHYNLQLKVYEILLKLEKYIPQNAKVIRILFVWNGQKFTPVKLEDIPEAWKLIVYKNFLED